MNCLSGQDDFFQTGNQPISLRHLSQPYNKYFYILLCPLNSTVLSCRLIFTTVFDCCKYKVAVVVL